MLGLDQGFQFQQETRRARVLGRLTTINQCAKIHAPAVPRTSNANSYVLFCLGKYQFETFGRPLFQWTDFVDISFGSVPESSRIQSLKIAFRTRN